MPARRRVPLVLVPVLLAVLTLGAVPVLAEPAGDPVDLATAESDLGRLGASLKSRKSINEQIIGDLDAVAAAYHNLAAPEEPEYKEVPADASEEEKKAIESENEKLKRAFDTEMGKFDRIRDKYRSDAEKLFLKALKLQKIVRATERNVRDDVNIRAAQLLGETGNPKVSKSIIAALEKSIFKAKYDVPLQLLEEAFAALGKINDMKSLEWIGKEFTHGKSSPQSVVDQLVAAHKSMILYKDVPGKLRYSIVAEMVKTYSGIESQARQSSADPKIQSAKNFWDKIKNDAIKAVQYFSGEPRNEDDEVLATMLEFQDWFRDHKSPRKAPWVDPKPAD